MWTTFRPRSRTSVLSPFSQSSLAAHPPEIPEPTTIASKVVTSAVTEGPFLLVGSEAGAGDEALQAARKIYVGDFLLQRVCVAILLRLGCPLTKRHLTLYGCLSRWSGSRCDCAQPRGPNGSAN